MKLAVKIVEIPNKIEAVRVIEKVVATTREEIKALIKLVHNPNIIKIEDVITDEREKNKIFLILEYCDNKDLTKYFQRLREQHLLTKEEQVIDYFCQILQGFEEMSRLNIIHYDIKPQNILVSGKTLKIADFGLSRQFFEENETLYENHVGTECTKAPQIKFKESYTSKCDIYSLGVTLYWMFYGKYPFEDNASRNEIKAGPQFDSDAAMKLSPETKYLLKQMLAFSEDDRITWK